MRSLLFSLRRVTLLSRHRHHQLPHSPIRNPLIPINPTSSFPHLLSSSSFYSSSSRNNGDAKVAGPLVEYERRIVAGELLDGDLCQVYIYSSFFFFILCLKINPKSCFFVVVAAWYFKRASETLRRACSIR